jgi:hypothetical protein
VLVATSLFVMLLAALFGIFWRTSKVNQSIAKLRTANEQMLLTQTRLQNILSNTVFQKAFRPYFFVEKLKHANSPSLVFTFENQIHTNYAFSNVVLGKLYVEDNQLCLGIFPHPKKAHGPPKEMRKEILLQAVADMRLEFFLAPEDKDEQQEEEQEQLKKPPQGLWTNDWLKEYEKRPTLIKLIVTKTSDEPYVFWFFIPNEIKPILYERR